MPVDENYKRNQSGNMARKSILDKADMKAIQDGDVKSCFPRRDKRRLKRMVKKDGNTIKEIK